MTPRMLNSFSKELVKVAQEGEGVVSQTKRRLGVAREFSEPVLEAALAGLAAKGLGVKNPKKLLGIAGLGATHGVVRKTKQYAG